MPKSKSQTPMLNAQQKLKNETCNLKLYPWNMKHATWNTERKNDKLNSSPSTTHASCFMNIVWDLEFDWELWFGHWDFRCILIIPHPLPPCHILLLPAIPVFPLLALFFLVVR